MATLLPLANAAASTCLSRCDFPAPAIPETSTTRSREARICSSALRCSSVSSRLLVPSLFVFLRTEVPSLTPSLSLASGSWSPPDAPGRWSTGLASCSGSFSVGGSQSDLSSSQGTLSCFCPALRPRSDLRAKPFAALRFCPRGQDYEGSNVEHYFEAQSHGFGTANEPRGPVTHYLRSGHRRSSRVG